MFILIMIVLSPSELRVALKICVSEELNIKIPRTSYKFLKIINENPSNSVNMNTVKKLISENVLVNKSKPGDDWSSYIVNKKILKGIIDKQLLVMLVTKFNWYKVW